MQKITVSVTNNSASFSGTGPKVGDLLIIENNYTMEVASGTTFTTPYPGPTKMGAVAQVLPVSSVDPTGDTVLKKQLVQQIVDALAADQRNAANWQQVLSDTDAQITVTLPDGSTLLGFSWGRISSDVNGILEVVKNGVEPSGAVDAHARREGAHPIAGVEGLQDTLNTIASKYDELDQRVDALGARKSTCLVNATGTGAPHETVTTAIPASIISNTRYVIPNPFGNNVPVVCWAEIKLNGAWCDAGFALADGNQGYGVKATYKQGEGVIVQTGGTALIAYGTQAGTGHQNVPAALTTAPCRVFVIRADS